MATAPSQEPTLTDVLEKINEISGEVHELSDQVHNLSYELKQFNDKFSNYQKATKNWIMWLFIWINLYAMMGLVVQPLLRLYLRLIR